MALAEVVEPMAYDPNEIVLPESEATPEAIPEEVLEEGAPEQEGSTKAKPRKDPIWKGFVSGIKQWFTPKLSSSTASNTYLREK